jgi:hypothetical protein
MIVFVVDDVGVDSDNIAGAASMPIESKQLAKCIHMDLEPEPNHLYR